MFRVAEKVTVLAVATMVLMGGPAVADAVPPPVPPVAVEYVQLPLNLPAGARVRQTLTRTTSNSDNGATVSATFTGEFLNQLTPHAEGFSVVKTRLKGDFHMEGEPADGNRAGVERLMQAANQLSEIRYVADINLSPLRIEQWPRFRGRLKSAMRKTGAIRARESEAFDALYGPMSAEEAADLFLPEDAFLAIPHNLGLSLNNPYRLDSVIPGPLGGTVSSHESLTLTAWDATAKTAEVTYESGPTREALDAYLRQHAATEGSAEVDMGTTCLFRIDLNTGLVARAECRARHTLRTAQTQRARTETWVLEETLAPAKPE